MRFETSRWSQHQDYIKQELILTEVLGNDPGPSETGQNSGASDELTALRELVTVNNNFLQELVELLINKQIMTNDDLALLKNQAADKVFEKAE